jgi:hypothetical protein
MLPNGIVDHDQSTGADEVPGKSELGPHVVGVVSRIEERGFEPFTARERLSHAFPEGPEGIPKWQTIAVPAQSSGTTRQRSPAAAQHLDRVLSAVPGGQTEAIQNLGPLPPSGRALPFAQLVRQFVSFPNPQAIASLIGVIPC